MKSFFKSLFSGNKQPPQVLVTEAPTTDASNPPPERKSLGGYAGGSGGAGYSSTLLTPTRAMIYYLNVAPLFTAVDMIASEIGQIDLTIKNASTGDYDHQSPIELLLNNPSAFTTGREMMEQLSSFFVLTGNAFLVATGPINKAPLELQVINPASVTMEAGSDGFAQQIIVKTESSSRTFIRKEVDGKFRFYCGSDAEIWHFKSFNTGVYNGQLLGMSLLNPITLELDQYMEASMHNLSLLKRGARPSGALKFDEMLTDEQFQRMQSQADRFYSGGKNAGRLMILENAEFQEMSVSNKDMDFATLKNVVTNTIYTSFRIPLQLINSEFSTYDNMATAKLNFYDNAVLPLLKKLLEELTMFIVPRFDRTGNLMITYDPESIEALEPRKIDKVVKLRGASVLTLNELRLILGYEAKDGGDEIYINSIFVPMKGTEDDEVDDLTKSLLQKNNLTY